MRSQGAPPREKKSGRSPPAPPCSRRPAPRATRPVAPPARLPRPTRAPFRPRADRHLSSAPPPRLCGTPPEPPSPTAALRARGRLTSWPQRHRRTQAAPSRRAHPMSARWSAPRPATQHSAGHAWRADAAHPPRESGRASRPPRQQNPAPQAAPRASSAQPLRLRQPLCRVERTGAAMSRGRPARSARARASGGRPWGGGGGRVHGGTAAVFVRRRSTAGGGRR